MAKENPVKGKEKEGTMKSADRKHLFAYSFVLMDLESGLYIAFGSSMKSEREAYDHAMKLLSTPGIEMDSIRLDRYYSSASCLNSMGYTKVFLIPKKNATLNGSQKWKSVMKEIAEDTMNYLEQYHQ